MGRTKHDEAPTGVLELAAPDRWAAVRGAFGEELARRVERDLTIAWIDTLWSDHLENVAELREGISLRTLGMQDPLAEYQRALVALFDDLLRELDASRRNVRDRGDHRRRIRPRARGAREPLLHLDLPGQRPAFRLDDGADGEEPGPLREVDAAPGVAPGRGAFFFNVWITRRTQPLHQA